MPAEGIYMDLEAKIASAPPKINGTGPVDAWLRGTDRQVAHMRLANASVDAIAAMMEITTHQVNVILEKPTVQKYIAKVTAAFVDEAKPTMMTVTQALADAALEAKDTVLGVMREMRSNPEPAAQRVALASAQDILDRAGHKPALRVEEAKVHAIHPETLKELGSVLRELKSP